MQIKVNQDESEANEIKVFVNAFSLGQELARKAWGE